MMTENQPQRSRGEAGDEAADERQRLTGTSNPSAEGSPVPADGPAAPGAGDPGQVPTRELKLPPERTAAVEQAPPAALRGREEDADPAGPPE